MTASGKRTDSRLVRGSALVGPAAGLLAIFVWALLLLPDSGGLHSRHTALQALVLLATLLLVRPWNDVSVGLLSGAALAALGLLLTALLTYTGWGQTNAAAGHLVGLLTLIAVMSCATSRARRTVLLAGLLLVTMVQFFQAWLPWWGSGDPNNLMVATFYWHNQLAAFFGALALLSAAIGVFGTSPLRTPALLVCPIAAAAVVLTTSRSALALLILGWLVLAALAVRHRHRFAVALSLPVVTAGALLLLTSAFFFPDRAWDGPPVLSSVLHPSSSASTTSSPVAGERGTASVESNGSDRINWTVAALRSAADQPLLGNGFGSFLERGERYLPGDATRSAFVHNGYAEALASGGLLFGGPVVIISLVLGLRALRTLARGAVKDGDVHLAASLSTLFLLGHSLVDFDWQYPGLLVLLGVCAGLLPPQAGRPVDRRLAVVVLVFVAGVAVAGSLLEHEARADVQQERQAQG